MQVLDNNIWKKEVKIIPICMASLFLSLLNFTLRLMFFVIFGIIKNMNKQKNRIHFHEK